MWFVDWLNGILSLDLNTYTWSLQFHFLPLSMFVLPEVSACFTCERIFEGFQIWTRHFRLFRAVSCYKIHFWISGKMHQRLLLWAGSGTRWSENRLSVAIFCISGSSVMQSCTVYTHSQKISTRVPTWVPGKINAKVECLRRCDSTAW
jgi:hypothetical protein